MSLSYARLDPSAIQIRLLKIIADENDENPVRTSLHTVSLNDTHDFEALSYVWGDTTVRVDILVDNCPVGVTTNLNAFLRALRQPKQDRMVWADYICINQSDTPERNSQILLMSQIYTVARSVVAWLGEWNPNIDHAVAVNDFVEGRLDQEICKDEIVNYVRGILDLCTAPYWQRLWTFQEWHLPKTDPICMCGKVTFTLGGMFSRIQEVITVAREKTIEAFLGEEILDEEAGDKARRRSPEADKLQMLYHLTDYKKLMRGVPRDAFRRGQLGLDVGAAPTYGLGDLLSLTVNRKCSHALDRVYALYALAPLARERYPPDYHKTVNQVNLETTSFILQHEANVDIFNDFDFCFNLPHNDQSLPSWVMEFIRTDQEWQTKMQEAFCTAMAPATALWKKVEGQLPTITDDLRTLRLWARAVGVVSSHWELSSDAMECFGAVQVLAGCIKREHNGSDDPFRLAETLINASYYYTGCSEFLSLDLFSDIMNKPVFNDTEDFRRTVGSYFSALFHSFGKLAGKSFFIIDNNFDNEMTEAGIGFADCEVRRSDFLIIPSGLAQVLILRPILEQMDNEDGLCFKIIGRAFLGGIADREESVKGLLINLVEMSPLRQFHIR